MTIATSEPGKDGKTTYRVTDPNGAAHTQRSSRTFTHALIRRNKGSNNYFVSWASSQGNAERECRVKADARDHMSIVPVVAKSGQQA